MLDSTLTQPDQPCTVTSPVLGTRRSKVWLRGKVAQPVGHVPGVLWRLPAADHPLPRLQGVGGEPPDTRWSLLTGTMGDPHTPSPPFQTRLWRENPLLLVKNGTACPAPPENPRE